MTRLHPTFRSLVGTLGLGLLSTACIITSIDDDDGVSGGSTDDSTVPAETGVPPGTTGMTGEESTGGLPDNCSENLILDPGFEGGTPSADWTETSSQFGTPICDASCVLEGDPPEPYAGDWWVWIGGASAEDLMEGPEIASVSQMVTIDPDMAFMSFWFQIRSSAGTGNDIFEVTLDGDTVFMATDLEIGDYGAYTEVEVDVSPWADGGTYELVFRGEQLGPEKTSFYVDEVTLVSCGEPTETDTGVVDDTVGQDSTATDTGATDTGATDTGATDTGATDTGGSSSSGA